MAEAAAGGAGAARAQGCGTGVLRAYYPWYFIRGLTTGIAGAGSLFIARSTGVPQHMLIASRGVGLTLGPVASGAFLERATWSGNAETVFSLALAVKMATELAIPRLSSGPLLCLTFFICGWAMAVLDTLGSILVTRYHGDGCSGTFARLDMFYSVGCAVAPFIVVAAHEHAWPFLAVTDLLLVSVIVRKRLLRGKPRNWKAKIRGLPIEGDGSSGGEADGSSVAARAPREPAPARVVRAGLAYTLTAQMTMTSVSVWAFTYGVESMGLPEQVAACIPGAFYTSNLLSRGVILRASMFIPSSGLLHYGAIIAVAAAALFSGLAARATTVSDATAATRSSSPMVLLLLACFALLGAGFSPCYSHTIVAMHKHGELSSKVLGWYQTCSSIGITGGMWLPGVVPLPTVEVAGSLVMLFILNANGRDFPRHRCKDLRRRADLEGTEDGALVDAKA